MKSENQIYEEERDKIQRSEGRAQAIVIIMVIVFAIVVLNQLGH